MLFTRLWTALRLLVVFVTDLTSTEGLLWPEGLYGLPKPIDGCPKTPSVKWATGLLYQDCEDTKPKTSKSPSYHLAGFVTNDVQREFCIKNSTTDDSTRPPWPSGEYCIYQKGDTCPPGLNSGWVVWDDESEIVGGNKNKHNGTLPRGLYNNNTKMYFCCSTKGNKLVEVDLPVSSPFYLIAFGSSRCQLVRGTTFTREFIYYETEYYTMSSKNDYGGTHPYRVTRTRYGHTIYYCYYTPNYCPHRVNPVNGYIYPPRCTQNNKNVFNDSCIVNCNPGFVPNHLNSTSSICRDDGTWDVDMLTECIPDKRTTPTQSTQLKTTTTKESTNTQHLLSTTFKHGANDSNHVTKKTSTVKLWATEVSTVGHALTQAVSDGKMSSAGRIIAGSICGGVVALGVIVIIFVAHCRKEKAKKSSKAGGLIDKSKSLEELVTGGSIILNRTASSENLIYADTGINEVQYFVKTDENPLYESAGAAGS